MNDVPNQPPQPPPQPPDDPNAPIIQDIQHQSISARVPEKVARGVFSTGAIVAQGAQEFDQRTLQIHQAPNTSSNLLYKNALLDTAKTIFSGLIVVDHSTISPSATTALDFTTSTVWMLRTVFEAGATA